MGVADRGEAGSRASRGQFRPAGWRCRYRSALPNGLGSSVTPPAGPSGRVGPAPVGGRCRSGGRIGCRDWCQGGREQHPEAGAPSRFALDLQMDVVRLHGPAHDLQGARPDHPGPPRDRIRPGGAYGPAPGAGVRLRFRRLPLLGPDPRSSRGPLYPTWSILLPVGLVCLGSGLAYGFGKSSGRPPKGHQETSMPSTSLQGWRWC